MKRGAYVAWTLVTLVSSAATLVVACSSDDSSNGDTQSDNDASPAPDAPGPDAPLIEDSGSGAGDAGTTLGLRFGDAPDGAPYCLTEPLPTTSTGQADCHIVILEADAGCGDGGLTAASSSDISRIAATSGVLPDGTLCIVPQLGRSCVGSGKYGYCYVTNGSCVPDAGVDAATCDSTLCASGDFDPDPATSLWLLCP